MEKLRIQNLKILSKIIMLLLFITSYELRVTSYESFAQHQHQTPGDQKEAKPAQKKVKYWTCGMHPQVRQDKPGNCPICNMKLVPIYEEAAAEITPQRPRERKLLYYRNPMDPNITSSTPMKDPMGMDYIPVYEEEAAPTTEEGIIKLSPRDISLAGVKSEAITSRYLFKEIRTVGRIAYDPELYKAEEEFIQAIRTQQKLKESQIPEVKVRTEALIEAVKLKLRLQGLSDEQIEELSKQEAPDRSLIISDNSNPYVWVYADIYEYELSWIKINLPVKVISVSFPQEEFVGKIAAIDPVLNPMTRSVRIRAKIENPILKLKPQMYADVFIESYVANEKGEHKLELAVPKDAILDTGMRKIVYLDLGNGSYLGREILIGAEATSFIYGKKEKFYPVISGLKENDLVVTKANFLIDSQSQLTGIAAAAYGGALGAAEEKGPPVHQH